MEEIIIKYLNKEYTGSIIKIINYDVDGSICSVDFTIDSYHREKWNINIWDMLVFLNTK